MIVPTLIKIVVSELVAEIQTKIPIEKGMLNIQKGSLIKGLSKFSAVNLSLTQTAYSTMLCSALRKLSMTNISWNSKDIKTTIKTRERQMAYVGVPYLFLRAKTVGMSPSCAMPCNWKESSNSSADYNPKFPNNYDAMMAIAA